jgi:hypothetical protein
MFSDMIDGSEPLDWSLLDQFFQNPSAAVGPGAGAEQSWEAAMGLEDFEGQ